MPLTHRQRWTLIALAGLVVAAPVAFVCGASPLVEAAAAGSLYDDAATIPAKKVGLLLGCPPTMGNGYWNPFFERRIQAAIALFRAGKVRYLLVSGNASPRAHDEPGAMRAALVAGGVPDDRIISDGASFRTLDSVVRAHAVFGLDDFTVISQKFHNQRAIYIGRSLGLRMIGFDADDLDARSAANIHRREWFARVRAVLDVAILGTKPRVLGSPIPIGALAPAARRGALSPPAVL